MSGRGDFDQERASRDSFRSFFEKLVNLLG